MKVIALNRNFVTPVGDGMGNLVNFRVDGYKADETCLGSFYHCEPNHTAPNSQAGHRGICVRREVGLFGSDQAHDNDYRKD
mmetsp:Transcript_64263/g.77248  ORF Transcript_64263/g.77248 Transcript_64263/m.77248 type:complete len:81 (-) Transcript_64263:131-373(-)